MKKIGLLLLVLCASVETWAQVLAPRAREVHFNYEAMFLAVPEEEAEGAEALVDHHASHIFGLFHSPTLVRQVGVNPKLIEGVGGLGAPLRFRVLEKLRVGGRLRIRYRAEGRMLLVTEAAERWLRNGGVMLPMVYDMNEIYNEKCTDDYYTGYGDYWYFYDPFRWRCRYLLRAPYSEPVWVSLKAAAQPLESRSAQLSRLRSDNGNGPIFSIFYIQGFSESSKKRSDEGRVAYNQFRRGMRERGFQETKLNRDPRKPRHLLTREVSDAQGRKIQIEIRSLLVNADSDSRTVTFAKFFRRAVAEADVLIYGGHSGLGLNLDIPSLEEKAGPFVFNDEKKQIFYFEACSSYSYYLDTFRSRKKMSRLDIMTNGLSSYFSDAGESMNVFVDHLINPRSNPTWLELLRDIEKPLKGASYLLNVGGL